MSFDNIRCTHAPVLELPLPCLVYSKLHYVIAFLLDSEYSESSGDSRVSVGTPELQLLNIFINVLSVCRKPVDCLQSEFRECSED